MTITHRSAILKLLILSVLTLFLGAAIWYALKPRSGEWSKPLDGIQGRLYCSASFPDPLLKSRFEVQLRNTRHVPRIIKFYDDDVALTCYNNGEASYDLGGNCDIEHSRTVHIGSREIVTIQKMPVTYDIGSEMYSGSFNFTHPAIELRPLRVYVIPWIVPLVILIAVACWWLLFSCFGKP